MDIAKTADILMADLTELTLEREKHGMKTNNVILSCPVNHVIQHLNIETPLSLAQCLTMPIKKI